MASFDKGGGNRTPFGKNEFLRSTQDVKTDSFTFAKSGIPTETIDGYTDQKVLQPGTVLAKIISGPDAGKVGVYDRGTPTPGVNEVQTVNLGAASAGTVTINVDGETTAAIAYNANKAAVQAAVNALSNVDDDHTVTVGGADFPGTMTFTFGGEWADENVPTLIVTPTGLTGGTVTVATSPQGSPESWASGGANGLNDPANIVGINQTFLPWTLMERDVEVAVIYEATVVQGWCLEYVAGVRTALTNETRDAVVAALAGKGSIKFR